ncbi:MAG: hypothetical protein HY958_02875 [Bacteroidia bacterium]|nr:hypothetical protein [Bacteroidia bacterium]
MAFRVANIVRAPGANPETDRAVVKTPKIEVITIVADLMKPDQVVEICRKLVSENRVHAIQLCPAVTNDLVQKVTAAIEGKASLFIGRGDFPSVQMTITNTDREWFS